MNAPSKNLKQPKTISKLAKSQDNPTFSRKLIQAFLTFFKSHWKGTLVILIATLVFFWPLITHISSYSEGGDAMFNAWTLARDQHCILHQGCPVYSNANIYFPHRDTMLYSETQLSAGFLTLPLYFINKNPIFAYDVWTIVSFFLSGWFMYLLAKYLSKGNEAYSILAGLIFEFAPFKMAAVSHLQNLSIFYLPLAILMIFKFITSQKRRYLAFLLLALVLLFYASWYQMVFSLIALGIFLGGLLVFKLVNWKLIAMLVVTVLVATLATLPLAKEYVRFSKSNKATFSIKDQAQYSSSLVDYVKPYNGTIIGKVYYKLRPHAQVNSFNSDSYSYHGFILYLVAVCVFVVAFMRRKDSRRDSQRLRLVVIFIILAFVGFIMSLGPLLKIRGDYSVGTLSDGLKLVIPLPYILVDKLLPQLSFIRAIGRASVLLLLALCCLLALFPVVVAKEKLFQKNKTLVVGIITLFILIELMPVHKLGLVGNSYDYNLNIPNVYKVIKSNKDIDNIVILNGDKDYPNAPIPVARAEWVLWAGYHNKNIFNGYSGYTPPEYFSQYDDFVDFKPDDVAKMKALQLRYVLVDKQLSSTKPALAGDVAHILPDKIYEDQRYVLFKI